MNIQSASTTAVTIGTGTPAELVALLKGAAADPTRIGAEYMPEVITVEGVVLADLSSVAAPAGTLAYRGAQLARHDGTTVGGNVIGGQRRVTGVKSFDLTGLPKSGTPLKIVAIPILAAEMVNGSILKISGQCFVKNRSFGNLTELSPGLAWNNASTQLKNGVKGWHYHISHPDPGVSTNLSSCGLQLCIEAMAFVTAGDLVMDMSSNGLIMDSVCVYADGTDPFQSTPNSDLNTAYTETTPAGVATDLWLMVQFAASGGGNWGTSQGVMSYDLTISSILP